MKSCWLSVVSRVAAIAFALPLMTVGLFAEGSGGEGHLAIWTVSSWERVPRNQPARPLQPAVLYAARRERESLQVAVRSPRATTIRGLRATDLVADEGRTIESRHWTLYRAHQLHLTRGTHRNEDFQEGWYPDALIPFRGPSRGQSLVRAARQAVPFPLPPHQTHTFWVDISIPEKAAAGEYAGSLELEVEGQSDVSIPIRLTIWPFSLPRVSSLRTEFGSPAARIIAWCREHDSESTENRPLDEDDLYLDIARLVSEHRINATPPPRISRIRPDSGGRFELSADQIEGWKGFLATYHVNAIRVPPPHRFFEDPRADRDRVLEYLRSWDAALEIIGAEDLTCYTYLIDEPNDPEAYAFTRTWGQLVRSADSRVKVLVTEQTHPQDDSWGDLYGAVDIWVPLFSLFDPESAAKRQALGEEIWTYTALCQGKPTPWWHIDYPLLNYRIPASISWLHGQRGLLYWGGLAYWRGVGDPWTEPGTYHGRGAPQQGKPGRVYNGEGSLLYPAHEVGWHGAVPSMRLKAIRDGIEDFDYLVMLDRLGRRHQAEALLRSLIGGWHDWSRSSVLYQHAHRKLGCLIRDVLE